MFNSHDIWTMFNDCYAYSVTIRTGKGILLGSKEYPCQKVISYFEDCEKDNPFDFYWLLVIEMADRKLPNLGDKAHFQGAFLTRTELSAKGLKKVKDDLINLFPRFSPAQKKNAIKVVKHSDPSGLLGYCIKTRYITPLYKSYRSTPVYDPSLVFTNTPIGVDSVYTENIKLYYEYIIEGNGIDPSLL